jgi:hypothetical protein
MKCLRIYSTANGESHFDQVEIRTSSRQVHAQATAFRSVGKLCGDKHPFHAHSVGRATFSQRCSPAPTR